MTVRQIVESRIPALGWIPRYRKAWLRSDVIAGVTTASVIIPKAMAYATVAGLAVQVGLYTALLPMVAYVALGSSLRLSVSTTTTIGILTAAQIAEFAPNATAGDAAAVATTLSVLVGILLVVTALLRLGFVAQFISEPVLTGFKAGIGVVIVVDQLPKVLGLLRRAGQRLVLAALNPDALTAIQRAPLGALLGRERMFMSVSQAIAAGPHQIPGS